MQCAQPRTLSNKFSFKEHAVALVILRQHLDHPPVAEKFNRFDCEDFHINTRVFAGILFERYVPFLHPGQVFGDTQLRVRVIQSTPFGPPLSYSWVVNYEDNLAASDLALRICIAQWHSSAWIPWTHVTDILTGLPTGFYRFGCEFFAPDGRKRLTLADLFGGESEEEEEEERPGTPFHLQEDPYCPTSPAYCPASPAYSFDY